MRRKLMPWVIVAVLIWYIAYFPEQAADLVKNIIRLLPMEGS